MNHNQDYHEQGPEEPPEHYAHITEAQVVDWLQAQREKHGLTHLTVTAGHAIPARNGHNGFGAYASFNAHTEAECKTGDSIAEAVRKLTK